MKNPKNRLFESASNYLDACNTAACFKENLKCESPIESIFLEAVCLYHILQKGSSPSFESNGYPNFGTWQICCQAQIENYRVDFLIEFPDVNEKLIVECDGHDFHERTKQQALRDRSRDRDLISKGYTVVRFTGSELWRDPWMCVEQIEDIKVRLEMKRDGVV